MDWITAFAAFLIAILSGMGMGSAGLLVVYLTMVEQVPQLTAQGIQSIESPQRSTMLMPE